MVAEMLLLVSLLYPREARANLAVGDMSLANEAAAATALLSAILPAHKACLVVVGRAPWSGDLFRALPGETQRALLYNDASYDEDARLYVEVRWTHHLLLVLVDALEDVGKLGSLPRYHRALIWSHVSRPLHEVVQNKTLLDYISRLRRCADVTALALTDADGDVHLYSANFSRRCTDKGAEFLAVDRWSGARRRWLRGRSPIVPFCEKWTPLPGPADPLNLFMVSSRTTVSNLFHLASDVARYGSTKRKIKNHQIEVTPQMREEALLGLDLAGSRYENCSLDGLLTYLGMPLSNTLEISSLFRESMSHVVVVVPAELGPMVSPLSSVTLEFSPAMWYGTALAALGTAAALACTLRRDRGAALLLALAPLLAQPPPPPPAAGPALRPLLAAWLLVCVVLTAAYQGLLLGMLSSARPRGEIDSLEALTDSGLPVFASFDAFSAMEDLLPESLRRRTDVREPHTFELVGILRHRVARGRATAVIMFSDDVSEKQLETWSVYDRKVHMFKIGLGYPRVLAFWHRGSELGAIIEKVVGRIRQAGFKDHRQRLEDHSEELGRREGSRTRPQPLTLAMMRPIFVFLACGLALAAFVFTFIEVLPSLLIHRDVCRTQNQERGK
ncbi:Pentatricopeptide repeat-containing protein [Frankliniella fusca]|uniref:Pentatricopeptide repeat-containing protein n=1 Tax=Frankliniella fusca TaxID=407009 RepID=A0AAE1H9K8_9NEOP|nr:Pentatricopeptide repeat-containing protein [Frankliniella fusca]